MARQISIYVILFVLYILLAACEPPLPTLTPSPESSITLGELQKSKDNILYGLAYRETITVQNCGNPLPRSDELTEARTIDRAVGWNIASEVGGEVEASIIAAGARIQAAVISGYLSPINTSCAIYKQKHQ